MQYETKIQQNYMFNIFNNQKSKIFLLVTINILFSQSKFFSITVIKKYTNIQIILNYMLLNRMLYKSNIVLKKIHFAISTCFTALIIRSVIYKYQKLD